MRIDTAAYTGVRLALIANPSLLQPVTGADGQPRIFKQAAPGTAAYPYIRMRLITGGEDNASYKRSFDLFMAVEAVSRQQYEAENLAGLIDDALIGIFPVYGGGWEPYVGITAISPSHDILVIQNTQYYSDGGQYRLRAVKSGS